MNIDLKPEEITELAQKIKEAVESLTNIDPIIAETAADLKKVEELKENADSAKYVYGIECFFYTKHHF